MSHAEYVERELESALDTARQAIRSGKDLLLAACHLNGILHALPELEKKVQRTDRLFIAGVSSECDGLPLGAERQNWAPESLRERDLLAQSYEQRIRKDMLSALARIADDLSK